MNRDIAIVGMVCKTPGADNIEQFWQMVSQGQEGLRALSSEEQAQWQVKTNNNVVYAGGFLKDIDHFDPDYFGYTARDAIYMDPQHRLFLQACCEALEISGHASEATHAVGVFASASHNSYINEVLLKQGIEEAHYQTALIGNAPDCLATRVSYCLNLTGPSMTIQSGCSSSLVAVHQARMALLANQCDAALVGGISLAIPHYQGYCSVDGGFVSGDGHCRPFSADADGTVFASGYGVLVVKRLADAITAGDVIYAIIKGSAINNDGSNKASFTAPSVQGQTDVIRKALRVAAIQPQSIAYIEAHGTGTAIGDPIEMAALKAVYSLPNAPECVLGSVKANIGHLDVAAGIIGLIKTSLMLHHQFLTPQIHFKNWNTRIIGGPAPFYVNTTGKPWIAKNHDPLRAGVSAFGFGGTNAHIIVEEYPKPNKACVTQPVPTSHGLTVGSSAGMEFLDPAVKPRNVGGEYLVDLFGARQRLIILSAKSSKRLLNWVTQLKTFLLENPDISLAEVAYSLHVGRKQWPCRLGFITHSVSDLIKQLTEITEEHVKMCPVQRQHQAVLSGEASLETLLQKWLTGITFNWQALYQTPMQKCALPATPFLTHRYWLDAKQDASSNAPKQPLKNTEHYHQWLYQAAWHEVVTIESQKTKPSSSLLVLGHRADSSLHSFLQHCQQAAIDCYFLDEENSEYSTHRVTVIPAQAGIHPDISFQFNAEMDPRLRGDDKATQPAYLEESSRKTIQLSETNAQVLIHWISPMTDWDHALTSILRTIRVVTQSVSSHCFTRVIFAVQGMSALFCNDNHPALQLFLAFCRGIRQEFPFIETKLVDFDPKDSTTAHFEQTLFALSNKSVRDFAVWRDGKCWQLTYQQVPALCQGKDESRYFKHKGVYLITGGLGHVASVHVEFLSTDYQATLILVGRSPIPAEDTWAEQVKNPSTPNGLKEKLQQLMIWKERGFRVVTYPADITVPEQLQQVCQCVQADFGPIDGLIHIAGVGSDMHYKLLPEVTYQHSMQLFSPKLLGVHSLDAVMKQFGIEKCLVISSISSVLAGIGLAAYAGVHNLLDATILKNHPTWRLMNWDAWNFHQQETSNPELGSLGAEMDKLAISPTEGLMVLREAFSRPNWQQLFISTIDLPTRINRWVYQQTDTPSTVIKNLAPRPLLRSEYVQPSTPMQQQLATMWSQLIGIESIGIQDSFFELGGDSLLALELIHRLQRSFNYPCTVTDLFEAATIAKLTQKITNHHENQEPGFSAARKRAALRKAALAKITR